MPFGVVDFWDFPDLIPELKRGLAAGEGLLIVLPAIEPIEIGVQGSAEPPIVYHFPSFEFRMPLALRMEPGEVFVQAGPAIDRVRHYLALAVGQHIPVSAWAMSHTSHAPVHRGSQPLFPWLTFREKTPEEVRTMFLDAYRKVEVLLAQIVAGSPLDVGIRSYGESFTAGNHRSALVSLWTALEVLGREYGPRALPEVAGRRPYGYLGDRRLAPDIHTFESWRALRNRIAHGSLDDRDEREILEAWEALLDTVKKAILSHLQDIQTRLVPVMDQMLRRS